MKDTLLRIIYTLDHNLKTCRFDAVEKRLSTIMVVTSLFGVINFELLTSSMVGTIASVEKYNISMQYYANLADSDMLVHSKDLQTFIDQSQTFLELHGDNPTDPEWLTEENWMILLGNRITERAVYSQSLFIGLVMYLAAIYWGLSTVSCESKDLTIWYRFVALPIYIGTIIYVLAVYILIQAYIDYVYCYLDGYAAMLAEASYLVLTKVVIAIFAITLTGVVVSNFYATKQSTI